jgi:hypothetical protein
MGLINVYKRLPTQSFHRQIKFTPKFYAGLKSWHCVELNYSLDGVDTTGITGLADQSGNGLTISQGTSANWPHLLDPDSSLNNRKSADYDGGDYLASSSNIDLSAAYTIVIAVKIDTVGTGFNNGFLRIASGIVTGGNGFCVYGENSGGKLYVGDVQGSAFYQGFNGHYATGAYVFTFRCDGTAGGRAVRKNGSVLTPTVNVGAGLFVMPSANKLFVGAGWNSAGARVDGKIPEVICYNVALTDAQTNRIEKYLGARYGITVS